jgi:iron complex outermembrane recepter protein
MSTTILRWIGRFPIGAIFVLMAFDGLALAQVSQSPPAATAAPPQTTGQVSGADNNALEEITVTAQHRDENLQKSAIAISAFSGTELQKEQIVSISSLTDVIPNVEFTQNQSNAGVFIRGIGLDSQSPGSDPRVAIYTDGIYSPRPLDALGSFYDIDRVEVLRGPQGTLYGRNATAGAMNIISREPGDSLNGYGTITVGDYNLVRIEGAVGGPISPTLSGRVAFQTVDRGGYGRNVSTRNDIDDDHERAVRAKLRYEPSSDFSLELEAYYRIENDHFGGYHYIQNKPGFTPAIETFGLGYYFFDPTTRDIGGRQPASTLEGRGISVTAIGKFAGLELTSITGYKYSKTDFFADSDPSTCGCVPTDYTERSDSVSQELRLSKEFGPVRILLGGYFFHENNGAYTAAQINGLYFGLTNALYQGSDFGGIENTTARACFANATVTFTDKLGIDLGVRYSSESRSLTEYDQFDLTRIYNPANPILVPGLAQEDQLSKTWSATNPKATIHYDFNDNLLSYFTYAVGFKSGGFNIGGLQPSFDPETLYDYEGGIKGQFFDRRLRANIAGFYYNYKNLQVDTVNENHFVTTNAAKAKLYGIEGEFTAIPIDNLRATLTLSWLHSEFIQYSTLDPGRPELGTINLAGNQLNYAPKYKVNAEVGYTFHAHVGDITPRASVTWTDRVYFTPFDVPYVGQPAYAVGNMFIDFAGDRGWLASLYVRNITNKYYLVEATFDSGFEGYPIAGVAGPPRTAGLSVTKRF